MKKVTLLGLLMAGVLILTGCAKQDSAGSQKTPVAPDPDKEGTCQICMTGSPCYETKTSLGYCRARGSEKWCDEKGECIKP